MGQFAAKWVGQYQRNLHPYDKFDFSFNDERIEVKSTSSTYRMHSFSADQLNPLEHIRIIVASTIVKRVSVGKSINDLISKIEGRIQGNIELLERLRSQISKSLGQSVFEVDKFSFDYLSAKQNLKFFDSKEIPKIQIRDVPSDVSDVKFNSNLTHCKELSLNDCREIEIMCFFV